MLSFTVGDVAKLGLRALITACLSGKLIFELEVPVVSHLL